MQRAPSHLQGFTLLELLVSLTIFALIGMGAHAALHAALAAQETGQRRATSFTQLQKALWLVSQDLTDIDIRSISIPAGPYAVSFMRRGWPNPLALPRSDMQQVAYGLEGRSLKRYYWPAEQLGEPAFTQTLLTGVSAVTVSQPAPRAVEITLTLQDFGSVRRVIEVPEP